MQKWKNILYSFFIFFTFSGCIVKNSIYVPSKVDAGYKTIFDYKPFFVTTSDKEKLSSVIYSPTEESNTTILFFHGNSGNISTIDYSPFYFVENGYNLLLFDYRGYGKSSGEPTPQGLNEDAISMIKYAIKNYTNDNKKLIIYAQSLGGAVALRAIKDIEQKDKINTIIVEGSFLSYEKMAKEKFFSLASYLIDDKYAPNQTDKHINIPILIIHSKDDNVVPYSQGEDLHNHFTNSTFWTVRGGHIEFMDFSSSRGMVLEYLKGVK